MARWINPSRECAFNFKTEAGFQLVNRGTDIVRTTSLLRLAAAPGVLAFAVFAMPALAQEPAGAACIDDDNDGVCDPVTSADGAPATGGSIVVTGSRIRLPNLVSLEPTVTITSDYIEDRGITNVADALNEIPGFRGSVTPAGAQGSFGQGVNFINTYGLGSNRTLTLLNGRRVVSSNVTTIFGNASPGTQVDLNTIPVILIDRVDRVSIGGAPVYGTDAIAGVVNIILKRQFEGAEIRGTTAITERGDNFRYNITGAGGANFADGRGNVTGAFSYEKVDGVLGNDRGFFRDNVGNLLNPTSAQAATFGPAGRTPANDGRINPNIGFNDSTTDGFPGAILARGVTIPLLTRGGLLSSGTQAFNLQFDRAGNLVPYTRGTIFGAAIPSNAARASGGEGFTFNDFIQITSEIERINANLFASYDLTDGIRLFGEGMFFQGKGDELVQQPTFNTQLFGVGAISGPLTFRVDNPFLSAQARSTLAANGYTSTFRLDRANVDLSDNTGSSRNRLYRGVIGVDGEFQVAGREYNFEVSGNFGRNDFTDFGQAINQQNFANAVNVASVNGQIVCSVTPTVTGIPAAFAPRADPACAPLNLFGEGAPSQAALDYVIADTVTKTRLEQFVINANVGGSPFDLFGNPVAFNVGYEHHEEKGAFNPDPFLEAGLGRAVAIAPTRGKYNLDEFFGEVLVPLITPQNNFIISKLEGYGRYRRVENSISGGFDSYAFGGAIAPIPDIEFRGNYTRSFRAPAIVELFSPRTNIFTTVPDLCSPSNRNAGPVPATRNANCTAFLARFPTATPLFAATATVPGLSGGNPNLENEQADSYTYGVIVRPRFIPGLSISADYIDIKLKKPISFLSVAAIAAACFDNPNFNAADPANGNSFCSTITRDSDGQVIVDPINPGARTTFVNGEELRIKAYQGTIDYRTKLEGVGLPGTLELGGDVFVLTHRVNNITGIAPVRVDGTLGDPKYQGQGRVRFYTDSFGFSTNVNYVGKQLLSRTQRGPSPNDTREFDSFKAYATVDASIFFTTPDDFRFTLSVTNLLDRIGQNYFGFIIPASINDSLGRRFALTVGKKF